MDSTPEGHRIPRVQVRPAVHIRGTQPSLIRVEVHVSVWIYDSERICSHALLRLDERGKRLAAIRLW